MSKGDIVLVPFPFTDLSGQKVRPALILYTEKNDDDCVVILLTSIKPKRAYFFDLFVVASNRNGLKIDSILKVNKMATLEKKLVLGQLGRLELIYMQQVEKKLRHLFAI